MNKIKKHYLLLLGVLIVSLHYYLEFVVKIHNSLIDCYLDDLLALPIILGLALFIEIEIFKKVESEIHSIRQIVFCFLFIGLLFEFILPKFSKKYTADYLDLLFYGIGAIMYYAYFQIITNHKLVKSNVKN